MLVRDKKLRKVSVSYFFELTVTMIINNSVIISSKKDLTDTYLSF